MENKLDGNKVMSGTYFKGSYNYPGESRRALGP